MNNAHSKKPHILIIDDEPCVGNILSEILSDKYLCKTAVSANDALEIIQKENFDLILSDIDLGEISGIEIIPQILQTSPDTVVMMISGKQTIESAIEAMRVGAFDYIRKPFELDYVEIAVERAFNHHLLLAEKHRYENHLEELVEQRTAQLNYLAYHDALTDLPNRVLFEDRLSQALILARKERQIALISLSLDRFKKIQDTLGTLLGKQILQEVAARLKDHVNKSSTLSRFEADEFALLLTNINGTEDIIEITNNISEALKSPIVLGENEIFITASIGISFFPYDGQDAQTLLKNAGTALSRAKEKGGNNYQFYTADMNAKAVKRLTLENKLRRALERGEFEVYYQPKIDVGTKNIVGMEALARWRHPEMGLISPAEFIPLAEDTGLIVPIGEWILHTACAQSKLWLDEGFGLQVSVNLSARQLEQRNLSEIVVEIIRETGLNPSSLNLEVTESSIMRNADSAVQTLSKLKEMGIKLSIDDFGTGYSSLGYLKRLPIDFLKIDKSFIQDVTTNPDDAALVMTIITLAHNLRLKVVAEGVETEEQLRFLHLLRCDEWQGYLFSKPVPAGDFRKLLGEEKSEPQCNFIQPQTIQNVEEITLS